MHFPYWEEFSGGEARFYPKIPISVKHVAASERILALVDSGAEHNIFGLNLAEQLGVKLKNTKPVAVIGVGEQFIDGHLAMVNLQLGKHAWRAPAIFSTAADEHAILGQAGFFAFFAVTFRYQKRDLEIQWVGSR